MIANEYDELDRELGQISEGRPSSGGGLRILPIVIGVVSLLALGGIVWYAYSQGVREGSEVAAPVLRPDSPAKVAPEDRGGREIAGTNLDVYDRISGAESGSAVGSGAGAQTAAARVERILPPPEEPTLPVQTGSAAVESGVSGTVTGTVALAESPTAPVSPASPASPNTATRPLVPEPSTTRPAAATPEPALAAPVDPPPTVGSTTEEVASTATTTTPSAPVITPPDPPKPVQTAAVPTTDAGNTPAASAGNGWRIQLAALRSDAAARAEWTKRQNANPDLLGGLALEVQEANVKGTQYFRVRGGPLANKAAATGLCEKLKAAKVACIPVAPGR